MIASKKYYLLLLLITVSKVIIPMSQPHELRSNEYEWNDSCFQESENDLQQEELDAQKQYEQEEELALSAKEYFKHRNSDQEVLTMHDGLALLNNKEEQIATAMFEIPEKIKIDSLSDQEKQRAKELFELYHVENFGQYKMVNFHYKDKCLLPENKSQALLLLYIPYLKSALTTSSTLHRDSHPDTVHNTTSLNVLDESTAHSDEKKLSLEGLKKKFAKLSASYKEGLFGETRVKTDTGYCAIEELKVGNMVASGDTETGKETYSKVTYVDKIHLLTHIQITINDHVLRVAPQQQFWVQATDRWVTAEDLTSNPELCKLVDHNIQNVQEVPEELDVVRISVNNKHNFYVTDHNILVHNFLPVVVQGLAVAAPTMGYVLKTAGFVIGGIAYVVRTKSQQKKPKQIPKEQAFAQHLSPGQMPSPDKDPKKNRFSEWKRMTAKEATELAEKQGFKRINETSDGQPVFKKGNMYITPDIKGHRRGTWKAASSVKELANKKTRWGTYNKDFSVRVGD